MLLLRRQKRALLQGVLLSILVLVAGVSLLGLSGWFITAAALAGLLSSGALFDVFRPTAAIRFLALGRTAARYGGRLLSQDAVLQFLAELRLQLFQRTLHVPGERLLRLRAEGLVNRVTADVEALDGLLPRAVMPVVAILVLIVLFTLAIGWLVSPLVSLAATGSRAAAGLSGLGLALLIHGYHFAGAIDTAGPSNPLLTDVVREGSWLGAYVQRRA